jgi:hypothetical protein
LASKLNEIWASDDYQIQEKLRYLLFPAGITYNREKDEYRTPEINAVFLEIARLMGNTEGAENEKTPFLRGFSNSVGATGLPPLAVILAVQGSGSKNPALQFFIFPPGP